MFSLFKKKKWFVVGRSEIMNLWTVTSRRPQVKCRLLLIVSECGSRKYDLEMLNDDKGQYKYSIHYRMIDQILPVEYLRKFKEGWTPDKINRVLERKVFSIEKTPHESFSEWR